MKLKTLQSCLLMAGLTASSYGATPFTEDFTGGLTAPMTLGTGFGSPTTTTTGAFTITSGSNSRIYLGTNDTDYALQDFTFEADVTVPNISNPWSIAFLGMGNSGSGGGFGEPTGSGTTPNLVMVLRNDENVAGSFGNLQSRYNGTAGPVAFSSLGMIAGSTYGMRMEWVAATQTATYLFDATNNGSYNGIDDKTYSAGAANSLFNATNSQLFLGGGNGLVFDNIVVSTIPEPTAALLGSLGVLALLRRRRN
jgi:MYXO-CTERM domain-containing protein